MQEAVLGGLIQQDSAAVLICWRVLMPPMNHPLQSLEALPCIRPTHSRLERSASRPTAASAGAHLNSNGSRAELACPGLLL